MLATAGEVIARPAGRRNELGSGLGEDAGPAAGSFPPGIPTFGARNSHGLSDAHNAMCRVKRTTGIAGLDNTANIDFSESRSE